MIKAMLGAAVGSLLLMSACGTWGVNSAPARHASDWFRPAPRNEVDNNYARKAMDIGHDQVRLSQLALQRSGNPSVRKFANRQIVDHQRFNEAMKEISDEQGLPLPLPDERQTALRQDVLQSLSGPEFDSKYLALSVANLEEDLALHNEERKHGQEISLKVNAEMQREPLGEHVSEARNLYRRFGAPPVIEVPQTESPG